MSKKIELLVRDYGRMIGLSRYSRSLIEGLTSLGLNFELVFPGYPWTVKLAHTILTPAKFDVKTFFTTYPVKARLSKTALKHLTSQQMASLLWLRPSLSPVVITVHDIIPYMIKGDRDQDDVRHKIDAYIDRQAMHSIRKADAIIAVSNYTRSRLIEILGCDEKRIFITGEGVNTNLFYQRPLPISFLEKYHIDSDRHYFLYVGSDNPRKNLPRLIQAFAAVHKRYPQAVLIKVGNSESRYHHELHQRMLADLRLDQAVLWLDQVPEEDLSYFYNLAHAFIFPSLYEGFGLPVLEAMACGTPVICSNATSLPEVAGDAALMVDPLNVEEIASAMCTLIEQPAYAQQLEHKGLERASRFSWRDTAAQTIRVYETVLGEKLL